jgi:hypothetical protein
MTTKGNRSYRPTESKYKGGAREMYVTYDLDQKTRSGAKATYPKVKRVYIAGDIRQWKAGRVRKRTGREVPGVRIQYEQDRTRHHREGYTAKRGDTAYAVTPTSVASAYQSFTQVVEVPEDARNLRFYTGADDLPERYRHALQHVR